jgi:hypothetical protein
MTAKTTITPGTYKLRHDLNNPKPDRRCNQDRITSWHQWTVWPAGMVFLVEAEPEFSELMRVYARGGYSSNAIRNDGSLTFGMLTSALDPIEETPADFLLRTRRGIVEWSALRLLDKLGVPLAEIERLMAEIDAEAEEE